MVRADANVVLPDTLVGLENVLKRKRSASPKLVGSCLASSAKPGCASLCCANSKKSVWMLSVKAGSEGN